MLSFQEYLRICCDIYLFNVYFDVSKHLQVQKQFTGNWAYFNTYLHLFCWGLLFDFIFINCHETDE